MALHPDNIHDGLLKITQYCEENIKPWENEETTFLRHFLYLPVLLINEDLYELKENQLQKVDISILTFNYFFEEETKMAYIFVVTKQGFDTFIKKMLEIEDEVEKDMIKTKMGCL